MILVTHNPDMMNTQGQGISGLLGKDLNSLLRKSWSFNFDIILLTKTSSRTMKSRKTVPSFGEWIHFRGSELHNLSICGAIYPLAGLA